LDDFIRREGLPADGRRESTSQRASLLLGLLLLTLRPMHSAFIGQVTDPHES
jgi:hypothetical protein